MRPQSSNVPDDDHLHEVVELVDEEGRFIDFRQFRKSDSDNKVLFGSDGRLAQIFGLGLVFATGIAGVFLFGSPFKLPARSQAPTSPAVQPDDSSPSQGSVVVSSEESQEDSNVSYFGIKPIPDPSPPTDKREDDSSVRLVPVSTLGLDGKPRVE